MSSPEIRTPGPENEDLDPVNEEIMRGTTLQRLGLFHPARPSRILDEAIGAVKIIGVEGLEEKPPHIKRIASLLIEEPTQQ